MNQSQPLGAHELLEINEILMDTINGINQFQLYVAYCNDNELRSILQNQIRFMGNEYNYMVQQLKNKGKGNTLTYRNVTNQPMLQGIQGNMAKEMPNQHANQLNDHDIAYGMLGCAKSTATLRMRASLECTDIDFRNMLTQAAKNSSDQAYEIWSYMNKNTYYQVPMFSQDTSQQIINHYEPFQTFGNDQMNQ